MNIKTVRLHLPDLIVNLPLAPSDPVEATLLHPLQAAKPSKSSSPTLSLGPVSVPTIPLTSVIGKAGAKINEIRAASQCQIRVTEPGTPSAPGVPANPDERLVTITGAPAQINVAVSMLYSVSRPLTMLTAASRAGKAKAA